MSEVGSALARGRRGMPWFVRGDVDGFFGLFLDNLVQLLLIDVLCRGVLRFPPELLYRTVLPGAAVSLLLGNLFYSFQAKRLADRTGRTDVCALPYGINTPALIAYVFLVMLPARLAAESAGHPDPARVAWQAGLAACIGSGLIEFAGAFVAKRIRAATPRAALLSTLAGVALGFISLGFVFRAFERPIIGLVTLAVILLTYFGKVHFRGGLPGGLVAVGVGSILAWGLGIAPVGDLPSGAGFHLPVPVIGDLVEAFRGGYFTTYFSIILPMGIFNLIGSLQNIESAEAAGDSYSTRSSLAVNGIGTFCAALFGSCFPTTLYIGHPGWKALGARAGYSILNGAVVTAVCLTGTLAFITWAVPIDAGLAIVIWIAVVITSQAFEAVPKSHIPAAVIGLLPSLAAWGALLAKTGLRAAGVGSPSGPPFSKDLLAAFRAQDVWIHGAFALEQGFIFSAMILSAATVFVIERRFTSAGVWCLIAAALCACGLMHSYTFTPTDTVVHLAPAWPWAIGYAGMGAVFLLAPVLTREREEG